MSSSQGNLEHYQISLEEIKFATEDFNLKRCIGGGGFGMVYIGELSERWQRRTTAIKRLSQDSYQGEHEFRTEVEMISRIHHENIISFIGYYEEGNENIIVYDYATNGTVDYHLEDQNKRRCLTWIQRLKICLGTARGLNYLHSGFEENNRVIHKDIKSAYILLDENLIPKICDFGLSKLGPQNQQNTQLYTKVVGTQSYMDPLFHESVVLQNESDVYSFGVVMFEMLSGMLVYNGRIIGDDRKQSLIDLVRGYHDNELDKLIDPFIRDQIDSRSFDTFKQIACQCISFTLVQRPTMDKVIERIEEAIKFQVNLEYYHISLEEIKFATEDFNLKRCIGEGGFGMVYIGELSERWQRRTAAIKRLSYASYQGEHEFRTEVEMISRFHHENIISFIGYCDEGNEKIIVYDYATNGSVDCHLEDQNKRRWLTWIRRLEICLETARGLNYLHSGLEEHSRVIHRDMKSANILLDGNMVAKICDFGLSRLGPRNQPDTQLYTKVGGTQYYVDPLYLESGILRKESDVYSFGVVMFEMLSGMLVYNGRIIGDDRQQSLINLVRRYSDNELDKLTDRFIRDQIDRRSFDTFKQIACECISLSLEQRPTMDKVIEKIEEAIEFQTSQLASPSPSESISQVQIQTGELNRIDTDGMVINEVIIRPAEKEDEPTLITINCLDTIGLGCDLCRTILLFGLSIVRCDISTDGKWCVVRFWVVGEPGRPWSLLKKRLSEACSSANMRIFNHSESHPPKPVDVFLIKICCHDQRVLPDMIRILCELGLVIKRVEVSTTLDGMVMNLFSVTDTRELLHTTKRKEDIHDHLKAILGDNILSWEIEMVGTDRIAYSQGPPSFIPLKIIEDMFNIKMLDEDKHESVSVSVTNDNSIDHADHTNLNIVCPDRKGVLYDVMRTLKDYNIQISNGTSRKNTTSYRLWLYLVQADGKNIMDPSKQSELCSHIRMELLFPLRVGFVNRGPNTELLAANPVELSGKGRPLVLYDITLALKKLNMDIFSAEISRHLIGGREWEVYRVLLNEGDKMFVWKGNIEEAVRKMLMGWDQ